MVLYLNIFVKLLVIKLSKETPAERRKRLLKNGWLMVEYIPAEDGGGVETRVYHHRAGATITDKVLVTK